MASSLFCELTEEELKSITEKSLHANLKSARLLTGGMFNTTYLLETENGKKYVLRAGPVNRHLLMWYEHKLMEAEKIVYAMCKKEKIPVSNVIYSDTSKKLIDRDFMLVDFFDAVPMSEIALNPDDKNRICYDIGKATAKMHSVKNVRFGRITEVYNGKGYSQWSACILNELQNWEKTALPAGIFTAKEISKIKELFFKSVPFLDEIKIPSLVHTDLWEGNILIDNHSSVPKFSAIIDADRALWGDPDFEFSSIRWTYTESQFWEGYGRKLSFETPNSIRLSVYTILNQLWNSYVYKIEYNMDENYINEHNAVIEELQRLDILLK